jgi:glycosyltransferase involved in cell wall biosynthesis
MAFGLPVVASRIGGVPETLGFGEFGVLVAPDNPEALAAGILSLARDPVLREQMGASGRAHAVSTFAADVVARRMIEAYEKSIESA